MAHPFFSSTDAARRLVPGAYERNTIGLRTPRATTPASGAGGSQAGLMSADTIAEREKEGGGGISQRPRRS
jgi:hypothetical protein